MEHFAKQNTGHAILFIFLCESRLTHAKNELVARECQIKELTKETLELKRENSELHGR